MAWRVSARIWRWRKAPCRGVEVRCSENKESPASVRSRSWRRREAPHHGLLLYPTGIKGGPIPRRVVAGTGPEGCRYAAASRTGIPILRALSIILLVMPEPGKATRPFGRKFNRTSLRRKGAALPSRSQFGFAHDLMDPVLLRQACGDLLGAGSAAVQQDHIVVLDLDAVQRAPDGGDVVEVLAAADRVKTSLNSDFRVSLLDF